MLLDAEWAQFWASAIGLAVAIGVPWRLHSMERRERELDRLEIKSAEQRDRTITAAYILGTYWDAYIRAGNLDTMLEGLTVQSEEVERFPVAEAVQFASFWEACQFKEMLSTENVLPALSKLGIDGAAEFMLRVPRTVRGFDLGQQQYAQLAQTGQLKITTVPLHIAAQRKRLKMIREACEQSIRAIGSVTPGAVSFEQLVSLASKAKSEIEGAVQAYAEKQKGREGDGG